MSPPQPDQLPSAGRPASATRFDTVIHAGRAFCAATGIDGPRDIALQQGRIAAVAAVLPDDLAHAVMHARDCLVVPGLIDLHVHAFPGARFGLDPDRFMLPRGTTTVLDQGSAGALTWPRFRDGIVRRSKTRIHEALNLCAVGEQEEHPGLRDLRTADVDACASALTAGDRELWGVAIHVGTTAIGEHDPSRVMALARAAADRAGCPLLFGPTSDERWPLDVQLTWLRPGDVVTYCFRRGHGGLLAGGRVYDAAWAARDRGIFFDLGHGFGSFSFEVAEACIAQGFSPDTISTDLYRRHVEAGVPHDLPRTLSKLLAAGMTLADALPCVTSKPAAILRLGGEIGTLAVGACADLSVLRWNADGGPLRDTDGVERRTGCWESVLTIRAGRAYPASAPQDRPDSLQFR